MLLPFVSLCIAPLALAVTQAATGTVELHPVRGATIRGELRRLGRDGIAVDLPGGVSQVFALRDCVSVTFSRADVKAADSPPTEGSGAAANEARAELDGGDWILAPVSGGSGDQLTLQVGGAPFVVNVDTLRRLVFPARIPRGFVDAPPPPNADRLYKRNGTAGSETIVEPVNGTVIAFREQGVEFEGVFGKDVFAFDRIVSLAISPIGTKKEPNKDSEPDAVLSLVPDGKLAIRLDSVGEGFVRGESPLLGPVNIPLRAVRAIRFRGDRFRMLSELEPAEVVETPYIGGVGAPRFSWRKDRSVMGGALRVAGAVFENGLGVHSRCVLTYALDGGYVAFRSKAGIDDSTLELPRKGSVVFRVVGDDKTLWESAILRSGDRPLETPEIDLRGVKRLAIVADYADGFDIADRANWCEPVLLRDLAGSVPASSPASLPARER